MQKRRDGFRPPAALDTQAGGFTTPPLHQPPASLSEKTPCRPCCLHQSFFGAGFASFAASRVTTGVAFTVVALFFERPPITRVM